MKQLELSKVWPLASFVLEQANAFDSTTVAFEEKYFSLYRSPKGVVLHLI